MRAHGLEFPERLKFKNLRPEPRCGRRAVVMALLGLLAVLPFGGEQRAAAQSTCQTPFLVYTDPANPGVVSESGDIQVTRGGVLLGDYGGEGRFAGYAIHGTMETIVNTATGKARVQGEFVATSPDGESAITVSFTGQVDFGAAVARGNFVVVNGTGEHAGYRAAGTIEGNVVGPATLDGIDIGLC